MNNGHRELVRFVMEQEHADVGERLKTMDFLALVGILRREFVRRLAAKIKKRIGA